MLRCQLPMKFSRSQAEETEFSPHQNIRSQRWNPPCVLPSRYRKMFRNVLDNTTLKP